LESLVFFVYAVGRANFGQSLLLYEDLEAL
jgi:hypothetical protein